MKNIFQYILGVFLGLLLCAGITTLIIFIRHKAAPCFKKKNKSSLDKARDEDENWLKNQIDNRVVTDILKGSEITSWFKNNQYKYNNNPKMVIAFLDSDMFKNQINTDSIGIDLQKNIAQFFYDYDESKILKMRVIEFADIEPNLEAMLIEHNGTIVLED